MKEGETVMYKRERLTVDFIMKYGEMVIDCLFTVLGCDDVDGKKVVKLGLSGMPFPIDASADDVQEMCSFMFDHDKMVEPYYEKFGISY